MNRRSFVNKLSVLTGGITLSLDAYPFSKRAGQISGKVLSGKKGVQNVPVTDGYTIVLTNNLGKYNEATITYQKFLQTFPNNELADDAKVELDNMGLSPEEIIAKHQTQFTIKK